MNTARKRLLLAAILIFLAIGQTAWSDDWNLKDKDGIQYQLSALRGKWVLVNFWAPWCPSCIQEMPELISLQKQHQDMQVIGVAVMYKTRQEVIDVVRTQSISYPVIIGNEYIASNFGEMNGMPTSFLYSPSGKLVGRHDGPLTRNEIEQALAQPKDNTVFSFK